EVGGHDRVPRGMIEGKRPLCFFEGDASLRYATVEGRFELIQCGRGEATQLGKSLKLAVAAADRDDRHDRRAAHCRVLSAPYGPVNRLGCRNPRRTEENEYPEVDADG